MSLLYCSICLCEFEIMIEANDTRISTNLTLGNKKNGVKY